MFARVDRVAHLLQGGAPAGVVAKQLLDADHLRRDSRHPLGLLGDLASSGSANEPKAGIRGPSSLMASGERLRGEEERLATALSGIIEQWRVAGDFRRLKCIELLFVAGWSNKEVASHLELTEQQVANYKFQVIERLSRQTRDSASGG